jgi:hypothetical protein
MRVELQGLGFVVWGLVSSARTRPLFKNSGGVKYGPLPPVLSTSSSSSMRSLHSFTPITSTSHLRGSGSWFGFVVRVRGSGSWFGFVVRVRGSERARA